MIRFDALDNGFAFVPCAIFPAVPFQRVHVIEPVVGGHDMEFLVLVILENHGKGEHDVEFRGVTALRQQGVARESAVVFERTGKSRPESTSGDDFFVVSPAVVVRTHCRTGGHID